MRLATIALDFLADCNSSRGCSANPRIRAYMVFGSALALGVHQAKQVLHPRMHLFKKRFPQSESFLVVTHLGYTNPPSNFPADTGVAANSMRAIKVASRVRMVGL